MSDLNITTLTGRLVRDPVHRQTESGLPWGVFTLASNYHYKDKKGDMALATGRLKTESWEKDGRTQYQLTLFCDVLRFVLLQNGSSPEPDTAQSEPSGGEEAKAGRPPF